MTDLGSFDRLSAALAHLGATIDARAAAADTSSSWTAKLLAKGPAACAAKVHEEGQELADHYCVRFLETSAKDCKNVE